jgi:predicted acylesterase/phospholipase RssA
VLKCHKLIDDEWKILLEETKQFENLKLADRQVKIEFQSLRSDMDRSGFKDVSTIKKKIEADTADISKEWEQITIIKQELEDERATMQSNKRELSDKLRQIQIEKKELQYDKMQMERERRDIDENRRDLSLLMPSIKKLMSNK